MPEASKSCSANRCRIARCPQRFVAVILSPDRLGHLVGVRSYVAAIVKGRFGSKPAIRRSRSQTGQALFSTRAESSQQLPGAVGPTPESANGEFYMTQRVLIADWGPALRTSPASDQVGTIEVVLVCPGWHGQMSRRPPARGFIGRNARAAFISIIVLGIPRKLPMLSEFIAAHPRSPKAPDLPSVRYAIKQFMEEQAPSNFFKERWAASYDPARKVTYVSWFLGTIAYFLVSPRRNKVSGLHRRAAQRAY